MAKTFTQIVSEMVSTITGSLGNIDTRSGTVLREAVLSPVAVQLEDAYSLIDTVALNASVSFSSQMEPAALDALAANFGVSRFVGSAATGALRFYRFNVPATPIFIPTGTQAFASSSSDTLSFQTIASATLSAASTQDPVTLAYYVEIPSICAMVGTIGNVAQDTINITSVAGIDLVTNPNAFTGGKDEQTNAELTQVIIARAQGNLGTAGGYESLIRSNFSVDDMAIIGPNDSESVRNQFGGAIDIVVLNEQYVESEESVPYGTATFVPVFMPLTSVTEIIGIDSGDVQQTLVLGTDYDVTLDTFSINNRSRSELSHVDLHITSFTQKVNSALTIRYKNSQLVRIINAFLEQEIYAIVGSDVLVKLAIPIPVNITADIRIIPSYESTVVQAAVETAITDLLNGKLLDDDLQSSDVITVIGNVDGVDSIDLDTFVMAAQSAPLVPLDEVRANKQYYIRAGTITVTVVG